MSDKSVAPVFVCTRCYEQITDGVAFVNKPTGLVYYHLFCFEKEFQSKERRTISPYSERNWK